VAAPIPSRFVAAASFGLSGLGENPSTKRAAGDAIRVRAQGIKP
jgi:hypothetical protein